MKKRYLKITVMSLILASSIASYSINSDKVYASEENDISVLTSSGNSISLYSDESLESKYEIDNDDIESGETYYISTTSSKIRIHTSLDSDHVRIVKGNKLYKETDAIPLSDDSSATLYVRVYDSEVDSDADKNTSYSYQYRIRVNSSESDTYDEDDEDDDIYDDVSLNNLSLMDDSDEDLEINFYSYISSYKLDVDDDTNYVYVRADLQNDDDTVKINSVKVDDDDSYERKIYLSDGLNEISVKVQDEDGNVNVYKIEIQRGENVSSSSDNSSNNKVTLIAGLKEDETVDVRNLWVQNDDKWQY
ncbi:cadherin-like beta sandwich domain-containing protein [Clostridium sp. BJN0001]|uniref:cadherin-like beta sandwich domain-containing protein n=1 Tax=Clostridium sp. BJN0001 TaxID=2930219 RepID=UPI001FCFCE0F|nr:cadherin-like beta sandwich domain-containing protein [Clostridium sp. BJN0001]